MQSLSQQKNNRKTQALDYVAASLELIRQRMSNCCHLGCADLKLQLNNPVAVIKTRHATLTLFFILLLLLQTTARAEQWFFADPLTWDARFMFDGSWRETENSPGNIQDSKEFRYREQLSFKKRIHILDPGLATIAFDIRPIFSQVDYVNTDNSSRENDSVMWNYAINSSFLHGAKKPFSLTAGIDRTTSETNEGMGVRTNTEMKKQQVTLKLKNIYFPSNISYTKREQNLVRDPGIGAPLLYTGDNTERWKYSGRSRKMSLNVESLEYIDAVFDRNYSYKHSVLNHRFNWGKKSYLRSSMDYAEQKDFGAYRNLILTENMRLQHTKKLFSTYRYVYKETKRTVNSSSHLTNIDINHRLYSNLTTKLGYQQQLDQYANGTSGRSRTSGPRYSLSYKKKLPMDKSDIAFGFNGSRTATEQAGGAQLKDVINYSKTFEADRVLLSQRYIDVNTIEVANSTSGVIYIKDVDYTIAQASSGYTEIYRIDIANGGQIAVNATVVVNFSYWQPSNDLRHEGYFLRLNVADFQMYYNLSKNDQRLNLDPQSLTSVTFPAGFLPKTNTKDSSLGVSYNLKKEKFKLGFTLENRHAQLDNYEARSNVFKQNVTYTFSPYTVLTANLSQSRIVTTLSDSNATSISAGLLMRKPRSSMVVRPHLNFRQQDDSIGNNDQFFNGGVGVEWRYYLITFKASLDHYQWNGSTRNNQDNRIMFNLIRRSK